MRTKIQWLAIPFAFFMVFSFSSCGKEKCLTCTWSGTGPNGGATSTSLGPECSGPGKEINRQKCEDEASNLTDGICDCVEN